MLLKIYNKLFEHFGSQGWWPVTKEGKIIPKYHKKINLSEKQKLEIVFGAILTQNTSWKNVEKAIIELNKNNLINLFKIKKIKKERLAKIIKSSGYHNQKAERLKVFSNYILKYYNGEINNFFKFKILKKNKKITKNASHFSSNKLFHNLYTKKNINELRKEFLSIKGIGPETADSIILYAAEKPVFVVDAYTKRIMQRFGFKEKEYDELQNLFMKSLEKDYKLFNEYHALLVELGKNYCRKKPLCAECPVSGFCRRII